MSITQCANCLRRILIVIVIFFLGSYSTLTSAQQAKNRLIVLTSFPDALFEPFRAAYLEQRPDIELHILNKKTSAAISYIQGPSRNQVDVLWASAPDAFEVLKGSGHLERLKPPSANGAIKIAGYPIDDPDGYYVGFAISGYGIMWNTDFLAEKNLPAPVSWSDLTNPIYKQQIGISAPSRSGTTHLIVESILQAQGWASGWSTLSEIGGNLATVTARSYGVPQGVVAGRFGIGMVIDFFGLAAQATGAQVTFTYPPGTAFLPANIAIVKGAENLEAAQDFIRFVTSQAGQELLFLPEISRLPIDPNIYHQAPEGYPNPFLEIAGDGGLLFNSSLSRSRYQLINALFDVTITNQLGLLRSGWDAVHRAEVLLQGASTPLLAEKLARARGLMTRIPVTKAQANDAQFTASFSRRRPGFPVSAEQTALEKSWAADARARYSEAEKLAGEVTSAIKLQSGKVVQ